MLVLLAAVLAAPDLPVDYARQVKPILVARCYRCHSSLKQESGLRLDSVAAMLKGGEGGPAVLAGKSAESLLIQAVSHQNDLRMPPEGERATPAEIALLKRWVDEGAKGPSATGPSEHWAFNSPVRPSLPTVTNSAWQSNPIDAFLAAEHERRKLSPAPPAPKNVLLRRVYLDLIGLPPTPDELREFLADDSPEAYEKVVDRLLASTKYGERWGRHWMDVWRYSDWDGYGAEVRESKPHIWRWRDWIVESLNSDRGYNQMVAEMLAGDELAPEDPNTVRATGYLVRNWFMFNRNVWLDNTVEHTGKAFLGLTINCARCHDHMYDPVPQTAYYQMRAFFEPHNVRIDRVAGQADPNKDGLVRAFDADTAAPTFLFVRGDEKQPHKEQPLVAGVPGFLKGDLKIEPVPLPPVAYYPGLAKFAQEEAIAQAKADIAKAEAALKSATESLVAAKRKVDELASKPAAPKPEPIPSTPVFSDDFAKANPEVWKIGEGKWEHKDGRLIQSQTGAKFCQLTSVKPHPAAFAAEFKFKTTGGEMWKSVGLSFDATGESDYVSVYLSAVAGGSKLQLHLRKGGQDAYPAEAARLLAVELGREYEISLAVRDNLVNASLNGVPLIVYRLAHPRPADGKIALWTYDASAEFLKASVETLPADVKLLEKLDGLAIGKPLTPSEAAKAAVEQATAAVALAEKTLATASATLASVEARVAADNANYFQPPAANAKELSLTAGAAEREAAFRLAEQNELAAQQKLAAAKAALNEKDPKTAQAVAAAEKQLADAVKAREAATAARSQPSESYTRFGPVHPASSSGRRAALARWIASDANPLTARVAVNHLWLRHFHAPLVPTVFDFGTNGKPPTHPELLDWLAVELMQNGWRMKPLHRLIVTSRAYQLESSSRRPSDPNVAADPDNVWLWRMNSHRMEAEAVRDAALHVAGMLDQRLGGPELDQNAGLSVPRRSLYFRNSKEKKVTFLALFDNPNVVECYRRSESIAPQQALAMANSTLTIGQARRLAGELSRTAGEENRPEQIGPFVNLAFERVLCRAPTADEANACTEFLAEQTRQFADHKSLHLFTAGEKSTVRASDNPHQRARENLVHVLLNHNDFLTVR